MSDEQVETKVPDSASQTQEPAAPPGPKSDDWARVRGVEERARKDREEAKAMAKQAEEKIKSVDELNGLIEKSKGGDWAAREELLKRTGISYDDWTKYRLRGKKVDPEVEIQRKVEETIRKRDEESKSKQAEEESKQEEIRWGEVTKSFQGVAASDSKYIFLKDEIEENWTTVNNTLKEMAQRRPDLTIEQAADLYEKYLRDKHERRSKFLAPAEPTTTENQEENKSRPREKDGRFSKGNSAPTLTNGMASQRTPAPSVKTGKLTPQEKAREEQERLKRAADKINW